MLGGGGQGGIGDALNNLLQQVTFKFLIPQPPAFHTTNLFSFPAFFFETRSARSSVAALPVPHPQSKTSSMLFLECTVPPPLPSPPPIFVHFATAVFLLKIDSVVSELDEEPTCFVCQDQFLQFEAALQLPCSHLFHQDCISQWLARHATCPTCRASVANMDSSAAAIASASAPAARHFRPIHESRLPLVCEFTKLHGPQWCDVSAPDTNVKFLLPPCGCTIHLKCMRQWASMSGSSQVRRCPSCRTEFSRPIQLDMYPSSNFCFFFIFGSVLFFVFGSVPSCSDGFSPRPPTGTKAIPRRHPRDQTSLHSPSAAQSTSF
jgi:hypothetical protein